VTDYAPKISSMVKQKCAPRYRAFHFVERDF
jgi:hypothetical protein